MNCLVTLACAANMIIIRQDVPDAEYRALALQPQFVPAARILVETGSGSGSGVLVAPQWVVTAAHVVTPFVPAQLKVQLGDGLYRVIRVVVHPQHALHNGFAKAPFDQALLQLERPSRIMPAEIDAQLPDTGVVATMVGYGVGGVGARDSTGTLRAATNRIDQVGGNRGAIPLGANLLLMDFDVPGHPEANVLGPVAPEPLEGMASGGDSGGGLFIQRNNRWVLTGTFAASSANVAAIVSRTFAGGTNIFVGIAANREWMQKVMQ
jgi:Trypsin